MPCPKRAKQTSLVLPWHVLAWHVLPWLAFGSHVRLKVTLEQSAQDSIPVLPQSSEQASKHVLVHLKWLNGNQGLSKHPMPKRAMAKRATATWHVLAWHVCQQNVPSKQASVARFIWHVLACWRNVQSKRAMTENKPCFEENKTCFGTFWHVLARPKTCHFQNVPSPKTSLVFLKSHGLFWVARGARSR